MIREITADQVQAVQGHIQYGIEKGWGPRKTALELVGRINRQTRRREGGIIGLTEKQTQSVQNARNELEALDPSYFQRKLRDLRYDPTIRKAMNAGKPLPKGYIDKVIGALNNRTLNYRGEMIARTETIGALNAGRLEGVMQMVDSGQVSADQVKLVWRATPGRRTRDSHRSMDGQEIDMGGEFISPSGARLKYPGDRSGGAPASEVVACRCNLEADIDWIAGVT